MLFGIGILGVYFYYYYQQYGNPLIRFQLQADGHYAFGGNYFYKPWIAILKRVTYEPLLMFINDGHIIYLILGLPVYKYLRERSVVNLNQPLNFWLWVLLTMLLTAWLMSTSWRYYNPISLLSRHFLLIIPPFASNGFWLATSNRQTPPDDLLHACLPIDLPASPLY